MLLSQHFGQLCTCGQTSVKIECFEAILRLHLFTRRPSCAGSGASRDQPVIVGACCTRSSARGCCCQLVQEVGDASSCLVDCRVPRSDLAGNTAVLYFAIAVLCCAEPGQAVPCRAVLWGGEVSFNVHYHAKMSHNNQCLMGPAVCAYAQSFCTELP